MYRTFCLGVLLALLGSSAQTADVPRTTPVVEQIHAAELAARESLVAVAPLRDMEGWDAELLLLNRSWREIEVSVEALKSNGAAQPVARLLTPSKRHKAVRLPIEPGSALVVALRLRYFDLADSLQAYVLYTRRAQATDVFAETFVLSDQRAAQLLLWPTLDDVSDTVHLSIINSSDEPAQIEVVVGSSITHHTVDAWQVYRDRMPGVNGFATVRRVTRSGSLVVHGLQRRGAISATVSTVSLQDAQSTDELTTVHVPTQDGDLEDVVIALGNPSEQASEVVVSIVSTTTGDVTASDSVGIKALGARTVSLTQLWPYIDDWSTSRIVIGPEPRGIAAAGFAELVGGQRVELSFFRRSDVHNSGSYPLYDFEDNRTVLHLLNQGSESALLGIELTWNGGTYSLDPILIDPDRGLTVDLAEHLGQNPGRDIAGRLPPERIVDGFMKWIVISGGGELLARTEIQPSGSSDRFGINCFGCCWETPRGVIMPGDVVVTSPGIGIQFETGVVLDTCSGTDGPFSFPGGTLNYSAPFSWNGQTVSASAGGEATLSFFGNAQGTSPSCSTINRFISSDNLVDACDVWKKSTLCTGNECDPSETCESQTSSCTGCTGCCEKLKQYKLCKKKRADLVQSEFGACLGLCVNSHCS